MKSNMRIFLALILLDTYTWRSRLKNRLDFNDVPRFCLIGSVSDAESGWIVTRLSIWRRIHLIDCIPGRYIDHIVVYVLLFDLIVRAYAVLSGSALRQYTHKWVQQV